MSEQKPHKLKTPWPTREAMQQIYDLNLWGGDKAEFYSGIGSHHPDFKQPYLEVVSEFLSSFEESLAVCDLGCGDFYVGMDLVPYARKYTAADIVEPLIERNRELFKADHLEFLCLDISRDELPAGDCAILRNVLQHLSNAEIQRVLPKLKQYRFLILTEHLPEGPFTPNKDIISGQGIRLKKQSGVDITAPPFSVFVKDQKQVLTTPYFDGKGELVTTLYTL